MYIFIYVHKNTHIKYVYEIYQIEHITYNKIHENRYLYPYIKSTYFKGKLHYLNNLCKEWGDLLGIGSDVF